MKVFVYESELYPCYSILPRGGAGADGVIEVSEEKYNEWKQKIRDFHGAHEEIRRAMFEAQHKREENEWLKRRFANPNPSRTQKASALIEFGWKQVDTSVWEKDGRQERLHVAYEEVKQEVLNALPKDD